MIMRSKVSEDGTTSIPPELSKKLGLGPGSEIDWYEEDGKVIVRRTANYTFEDIYRIVFGGRKLKPHTVAQMDEGIRQYIRKYARD